MRKTMELPHSAHGRRWERSRARGPPPSGESRKVRNPGASPAGDARVPLDSNPNRGGRVSSTSTPHPSGVAEGHATRRRSLCLFYPILPLAWEAYFLW